MTEPSAKISVGVAVTVSFCASAAVAWIGSLQSPLLSGSVPLSKNASQAFWRSGAHQIWRDLRAASGCSWSIGNRNV